MSRNSISTNQELRQGEFIQSLNDKFYAILQTDGNLVVYARGGGGVWSTQTQNTRAERLVLQPDGKLVLLDVNKKVIWHNSVEVDPSSRMRLTINDQGYLMLDNDGDNIWRSTLG